MARPKSTETRGRKLQIRLTEAEHDKIKEAADREGLPVSQYVRRAALKEVRK